MLSTHLSDRELEAIHRRLVRVATAYLRDRQAAEDLSQESILRLLIAVGDGTQIDNPEAWCTRVLMNLAKNTIRSQQRFRLRMPQLAGLADDRSGSADVVDIPLGSLTPRQRQAVLLRYYCDCSVDETASIMRCRAGTVRALTAQGIARLRADHRPSGDVEREDGQCVTK